MTKDQRSTFRCARLAAAALALGIFTSAGMASVSAQDASPVASPDAVVCVSPGLPPGTPTPMDEMGDMDMGTPVGDTADLGSPVAVEEEAEAVTGTPADEATAVVIFGAIQNYAACYNEGQASGNTGLYVALESSNYIASQGYATPFDRAAEEAAGPPWSVSLLDLDNAMVWDDGRVSADAQLLIGDHWYNHWRIFLTDVDGAWLYDQEAPLPPTPDVDFVSVNGINIADVTDEATGETAPGLVSFSGSTDFTATDAIIFNVTNSLAETYEVMAFQLPEGVDPAGLLDGSVSWDDVTFLAEIAPIQPEGAGDLTLINLPVGSYVLMAGNDSDAAPLLLPFNIVEPAS